MDVVTDLTSYAVSVITTVQDLIRFRAAAPGSDFQYHNKEALWTVYRRLRQKSDNLEDKVLSRVGELIWSSHPLEDRDRVSKVFNRMAMALMEWLELHTVGFTDALKQQYQLECNSVLFIPHHWRYIISNALYRHPEQRLSLADILQYMPIQVLQCLGAGGKDAYYQRLYQMWKLDSTLHTLSQKDLEANTKWWSDTQNNIQNHHLAEALLQDDTRLLQDLQDNGSALPFETFYPAELREVRKSRIGRLRNQHKVTLTTAAFDKDNPTVDTWLQQIITEQENWVQRYNSREEPPGAQPQASTQRSLGHRVAKAVWGWLGTAKNTDRPIPPGLPPKPANKLGPVAWGQQLQLVGLAFSGGGIRSATFNLGVLQHLSEKGFLPFVDYLSTVSGGGYTGSWLASWIREAGSVQKVAERLNAKKSADPMAEEVRPVRWLRMYSNYLTPQASIMSADAWTMGITWLRNTLVNQVILVLLTCTVLSALLTLFFLWEGLIGRVSFSLGRDGWQYVLGWSLATLVPVCFVAGVGMRTYNWDAPPQSRLNKMGRHSFLSIFLTGWALLSALYIAAWMFPLGNLQPEDFSMLLPYLFPTALVGLLGLLGMAYVGRYQVHWGGPGDARQVWGLVKGYAAIIASSVAAAALGWLLLAAVWLLVRQVGFSRATAIQSDFARKLCFILAPPLILEVFSIVVVMRMAIMGNLFPDGRREWWGKMGAIKHRFSLAWILVCYPTLFFADQLLPLMQSKLLPAVAGGWAGVVGYAVKLAYAAGPQPEGKGGFNAREIFIRFAPYLFIIGFLLLCTAILTLAIVPLWFQIAIGIHTGAAAGFALLTLVLALLTVVLGWRVGVNEFSLHYFYRNRLVRAYLGAVRRRTDRSRTANGFTGFDEADDQPLKAFRTCMDYYGPYPLINTTLNASVITELDRQDRKGESFIFSPLYCGFDVSPTRSASFSRTPVFDYGYRPTDRYAYAEGPTLGTAMAISGAAVNPNMGYHSSAATSFLLTVFNVRLGWWMGNPRGAEWRRADPFFGLAYIIKDLVGKTDISSDYVCLSDGGHFDNMGLYELVRRRCKWIILSDAEEDADLHFEGLANAIRRCYIDFGAVITIDVKPLQERQTHVVFGDIRYAGELQPWGHLMYIKPVLNDDEPTDIVEYKKVFAQFPHQSTGDQFFNEAQFESYRHLGWHSLACNSIKKRDV